MRDRFGLSIQLLFDSDLDVAPEYAGVQETERFGPIPIAGTFVIDSDGVVRYAQISEDPADRTYANYARHLISSDFEEPYTDYEY